MPPRLSEHPVHLGLGATAVSEPRFTGMEWYAGYLERHATDGNEARLVAMHSFSESWSTWEMHPLGCELVVCTAGTMTVIQEIDGREVRTNLAAGEYVINEPGVWHTVDLEAGPATAVFVTAGKGTEVRPRSSS